MVAYLVLCLSGKKAADWWTKWHVSNRRWLVGTVAVYFMFLLLQSNYKAFEEVRADSHKSVDSISQQLDKANTRLDAQEAIIDQLTKEKVELEKAAPVLTGPQWRIKSAQDALNKQADTAPTKDQFTPDLAHEWSLVAVNLHERTVNSDSDLSFYLLDKTCTWEDLVRAVGSLRGAAANLTEDDLRDNTPKQ